LGSLSLAALLIATVGGMLLTPLLAASPAAAAPTAPGTAVRAYLPDLGNLRAQLAATTSTSADWSGYATTGDTYSSVSGSWTQPAATCSSADTAYAAFWVGLDGDTTRTVEQIGTESDCAQGSPVYAAWYEMYPAAPVSIDRPVAPGDSLSGSVTADGAGGFTLTLNDSTQGWTFSTTAAASRAQLGSAEWIAEAPSNGRRALPLANFGTVSFTQCAANGTALGANPNLEAITLAARNGPVEAQPSSLTSDGAGFSVTWQQDGTSGGSSGSGSSGSSPTPTQPFPGHHHHSHGSGGSGSSGGGWGGGGWGGGGWGGGISLP
jgi:hypothetical protein